MTAPTAPTREPTPVGSGDPVILAERVSKRYELKRRGAESRLALEGATLRVDRGEFVTLVGPSGCGKTTLLKISAGLIAPTGGEVRWFGEPRPQRRFGMMVFQAASLLPWRTVLDNVTFPATILGWPKKAAVERARQILETVQLPGIENRYPDELSGGMQQRVSIARALLADPDVLFMDEPFGALDAMTREELNVLLQNIQAEQSKTVVFVTHNIQEAVFLSDRVAVMDINPGRIKAEIRVPLPRPRTLGDMLTAEFNAIEAEVRDQLGGAHGEEART